MYMKASKNKKPSFLTTIQWKLPWHTMFHVWIGLTLWIFLISCLGIHSSVWIYKILIFFPIYVWHGSINVAQHFFSALPTFLSPGSADQRQLFCAVLCCAVLCCAVLVCVCGCGCVCVCMLVCLPVWVLMYTYQNLKKKSYKIVIAAH